MLSQSSDRPRRRGVYRSAFLLQLCPMCQNPLSLASIVPHPADSRKEIRSYRCDACQTVQTREVERREPR